MNHPVIEKRWKLGECPLVTGVTYGDGTLVLMECLVFLGDDEEVSQVVVHPLARSTIDSFLEYNPDRWVHVGGPEPMVDEARGLALSFGEGSMGGDGFVALCDASTGELRWVAFFQESNPFTRAWLDGDAALAVSSHGHVWRFPLEKPERVQVTCASDQA